MKHLCCASYHLASNGAVERLVQTVKKAIKSGERDGVELDQILANFLLQYRATPHTTTGRTPSSLFLGCSLRTRLDLLQLDLAAHFRAKQADQKAYHDLHSRVRKFHIGQSVMVQNMSVGPTWMTGIVVDKIGPLSYIVQVPGGRRWKRHVNHLRDSDLPVTELATTSTNSASATDFQTISSSHRSRR